MCKVKIKFNMALLIFIFLLYDWVNLDFWVFRLAPCRIIFNLIFPLCHIWEQVLNFILISCLGTLVDPPLNGSAPPQRKILDPPLGHIQKYIRCILFFFLNKIFLPGIKTTTRKAYRSLGRVSYTSQRGILPWVNRGECRYLMWQLCGIITELYFTCFHYLLLIEHYTYVSTPLR